MKKYFLDANIIIDYLLHRQVDNNLEVFLKEVSGKNIYISSLTVHIIFYVLKIKYNSELYFQTKNLLNSINIIPQSNRITELSLNTEYKDFEDTIQFISAQQYCDTILTRDVKDFNKIKDITKSRIEIIFRYE